MYPIEALYPTVICGNDTTYHNVVYAWGFTIRKATQAGLKQPTSDRRMLRLSVPVPTLTDRFCGLSLKIRMNTGFAGVIAFGRE